MATIVLSAIGTAVGGPLGGAVGALLGRAIDGEIFAPRQEGPRLRDLKVSGSSYGDPIGRQYGQVRAPGTIIWSTDLKESSERSGGKGQPKGTTYSYSISFAVALSSGPVERVGRIWADGNLLRGAAGDLKTQGIFRLHAGHHDQFPDPLMKGALGAQCPAFRGCAYAVFEDLQLADFGNRIPALSFEVFAGDGSRLVESLASQAGATAHASTRFPELAGFSHEGGTFAQIIGLVDRLAPMKAQLDGSGLTIASAVEGLGEPVVPGEAAAWQEGDFGKATGTTCSRAAAPVKVPGAVRYYDPARDYQPGLQRCVGLDPGDASGVLECPATLTAGDALALVSKAQARASGLRDTMSWRMARLDPQVGPGTLVAPEGIAGMWQVESWEWREGGIELSLRRFFTARTAGLAADPGSSWTADDLLPQPTVLRAFEVPWDGFGSSSARRAYLAVGAGTGRWDGAALYWKQGEGLVPFGTAPSRRAVIGTLAGPLASSRAIRFEPEAVMTVALADDMADLAPASIEDLARGANRALVGREIVQFADARPLSPGYWELRGLLRGRGGTEGEATQGHGTGADFVLLDDRLVTVDDAVAAAATADGFAAIGLADPDPVTAALDNAMASVRPPCPVHPRTIVAADGSRSLQWTRRARGGWAWLDEVEAPLVEPIESYELGIGSPEAPEKRWSCPGPARSFTAPEWASLCAANPGASVWVRQCGLLAKSDPLLICTLT